MDFGAESIHSFPTIFWLSKLMGFQYVIEYREGSENTVANTLSSVHGAELLALAISSITSNVLDHIKASYQLDSNPQQVISQLE